MTDMNEDIMELLKKKEKKEKKKKKKKEKKEKKKKKKKKRQRDEEEVVEEKIEPVAKKAKKDEGPTRRIRTRSMDAKEDKNGNPPLSKFRISSPLQSLLMAKGITHLFPIQSSTFDAIYDGKDVIGRARTGQGKTLAFSLPIIEKLRMIFATHGLPQKIVTDNEPSFTSDEFKRFVEGNGIKHVTSAPYHP